MFTGLVQATGQVLGTGRARQGRMATGKGTSKSRDVSAGGIRLSVRASNWDHIPARGDSISVSGCCLTIAADVDRETRVFEFDVVPETLRKTKLGMLKPGDRVNLEHAATLSTLLGGHLVQGHVDGVAEVIRVTRPGSGGGRTGRGRRAGGEWRVRIAVPTPRSVRRGISSDASAGDLMQYIIPKGSICVDGTSLTVASLWSEDSGSDARGFEVALIPETLEKTTLGELRAGDLVNLEVDAIAKTVVHWLRAFGASGDGTPGTLDSAGKRTRRTR